eukprot:CAMPEP_0194229300 /NCGR_PEP_ID=MMETSP0156-20130528/43822_1 /TAXON_ID=33649 /ORGANISM="Thalassionema nitzschioides, Strain L26-B" /LENGTH=1150 /DNA_ID=CAMNT_0038961849 /DNA_START=68 /DNA_END=3517 /DNA_ORIENTATION=-
MNKSDEDSGCNQQQQPLSWRGARVKLREVLDDFMENPPQKQEHKVKASKFLFDLWFKWDMDVYAGSFLASFAFLLISSLSLSSRLNHPDTALFNASADISIYRNQVAAAAIIMTCCLLSGVAVVRRRNASAKDLDPSKRRAISKYLSAMRKENSDISSSLNSGSHPLEIPDVCTENTTDFVGTSLSGIYPVFRTSGGEPGNWVKIPDLLLVQGDYVALQIGDIVPADCRSSKTGKRLRSGESLVRSASAGKAFASAPLPLGRSSIEQDSRALLPLCNLFDIFIVEEAPVLAFLQRSSGRFRSPQVHRQLYDIRKVMYGFSVLVFGICVICIFCRPTIFSADLSLLLHAPILGAMAGLPILSPIFLMVLEMLGTARILSTAHPYATKNSCDVKTNESKQNRMSWYFIATAASRLLLTDLFDKLCKLVGNEEDYTSLMPIPAASMCLLEKLGVATAFTVVDDYLACETDSIPQQLLIPSANGLKLLDICPTYDEGETEDESSGRKRTGSGFESPESSDSEDTFNRSTPISQITPIKRFKSLRKRVPIRRFSVSDTRSRGASVASKPMEEDSKNEVQFEDPLWWQHLPSLKCIGLTCMLIEREREFRPPSNKKSQTVEEKLVSHIAVERRRKQFQLLGSCIGFDMEEITSYKELTRLQVISCRLFSERLKTHTHALGREDARNWGKLCTDSTSLIVQDNVSKAYHLLTVGDPRVVTALCHEAWQGENATILPFSSQDRSSILTTCNDWRLSDLDVAAFSYTPLPHNLEQVIESCASTKYLLDNVSKAMSKDNASHEWSIIDSQIFMGVLASSIVPRKEIEKLLETFDEAGVRFVYFSPRNMRRTKEVASQMGIDVAWNCAISLRPLDEGEDDQYRMTSNYADWDVNAKLPHGIVDVRKHLEEVDNVPLLVSLFTDVTKENTSQMLEIFQEYHDTVIAVGLSHLAQNAGIFDCADLSVGIDVLFASAGKADSSDVRETTDENILSPEIDLVRTLSTVSCIFRLRGPSSVAYMPYIIASSRAALQAASSAYSFNSMGCMAYMLFVVFSMCSISTALPIIPSLGSVLYLFVSLPLMGISLAMTQQKPEGMKQVPPKNDPSQIFGKKERFRAYLHAFLKSIFPAAAPQLLWYIAFVEILLESEPQFIDEHCGGAKSW